MNKSSDRISGAQRIALLSVTGEQIFHGRDLANLWNITNENSLYTLLKRYTHAGLLHRIYKGFYSTLPLEKLNPLLVGAKALHQFCYLSTETVLFREGFISQKVNSFTFVSCRSLKFNIGDYQFVSRQLVDRFLYQTEGILSTGSVKIATSERAIADMLYFNSSFHFDRPVNWKLIKILQQKIGYPLTPHRYIT